MSASTKYFLICASRDHVRNGVKGKFVQAGHGRLDYMAKLSKGDGIVFYSSKDEFENGEALQKFTAIGEVADNEPYQAENKTDFKPHRRNTSFFQSRETEIRPLLDDLSFIKNKKKWGFYLISGFREIPKADFEIIKKAMM